MAEGMEVFIPVISNDDTEYDVDLAKSYVATDKVLSGGLQVALESVSYTFGINNISRATTHQLVRTRVGAGFSQQSFRFDRISNFNVRMPDSICHSPYNLDFLRQVEEARKIYDKLVEKDVPYEDARAVCPIATTTHIIATYNYRALRDLCAQRLCNQVQWEIHEVVKLMKDAVTEVDEQLGEALKCKCDVLGKCTFLGLGENCGKW